jgi:hypothetical protein
MKHYLVLLVMLLAMINVALGAVGDVGISDTSSSLQSEQSVLAGTASTGTNYPSSGLGESYAETYVPYDGGQSSSTSSSPILTSGQGGYLGPQGNYPSQNPDYSLSQKSAYPAPQISGPLQEQLTAEELGFSRPQMESFTPDESLGFISATLPGNTAQLVSAPVQSSVQSAMQPSVQSSVQAAVPGSSAWYYPGSVISANRFYVQTVSGFGTVGGVSYKGYLPLWADIKSSGNFFVYEWYPGQSTPYVQWWGWTSAGWKKGWFCGDVPGWHTLCYNSGIWSNYIYIYVYPSGAAVSASYGYSNAATSMTAASISSGAPVPPDPGAERLVLPDFNQYKPITDQYSQSGYNYPVHEGSSQLAAYPSQFNAPFASSGMGLVENPAIASPAITGQAIASSAIANPAMMSYPNQAAYPGKGSIPGKASSSTKTYATCTSSTIIAGGVSSNYPCEKSCPTCVTPVSQSAPCGYVPQSYKAVYPVPSVCKCNEYYVQSCPGRLATVAGVFSEEWLPLWSKVSRPGVYWSFEWTTCDSGPGPYCSPEVKNFGYKNVGWYQTWFKGNNPGWHILSYQCNDWSNYIYIYVWPAD